MNFLLLRATMLNNNRSYQSDSSTVHMGCDYESRDRKLQFVSLACHLSF